MRVNTTILIVILLVAVSYAEGTIQQDEVLMLYSQGRSLVLDGKFQQAISTFENLVDLYPSSRRVADAHFYMGYCYEQLGKVETAFKQYRYVTDHFDSNLVVFRKSANRAMLIAKKLSGSENPEYGEFLNSIVQKSNNYSDANILAAINLAERGDWGGKEILLRGLKNSPIPVQLKISELLGKRVEDSEVEGALRDVVEQHAHPSVRINAIKALASNQNEKNKELLIRVVESEDNPVVKSVAARVLVSAYNEKSVEDALVYYLKGTDSITGIQSVGNVLVGGKEGDKFTFVLKERLHQESNSEIKYTITKVIDDKLDSKEVITIWSELSDSPEPEIRVKALRNLKDKPDSKEIEVVFMEKLEDDPDSDVKVTAISGLKDKVNNEEVQKAFFRVITSSNDPIVISSSAEVLSRHLDNPDVLNGFLDQIKNSQKAIVGVQATRVLINKIDQKSVQEAIVGVIKNEEKPLNYRRSILFTLSREAVDILRADLERIRESIISSELKSSIEDVLKGKRTIALIAN